MIMAQTTTEALILKVKNFHEADRIFTLYSKRHGKIRAIAKGVRKITSKRGGNLDLLNLVRLSINDSHKFPIITEASVINSFRRLKANLKNIQIGYGVLELLDKFLPEGEENRLIYDLVVETLENLSKLKDGGKTLAITYFKFKLLVILGYDPVLDFCVLCFRDYDDSWKKITFNGHHGGIICDRCTKAGIDLSPAVVGFLRQVRILGFSNLQKQKILKSTLDELGLLLKYYIEFILEESLRSSNIFGLRILR